VIPLRVRDFGRVEYHLSWEAMRAFTDARDAESPDELWLVEHDPVFTLGQAGKMEHVLEPGTIPIVHSDRGGQVTYHGPGQIVIYTLVDLRRRGWGIREFVQLLESAVVSTLDHYEVASAGRREAPGVYVDGQKIAALGLRVRNGRTFHGLSLNVNMDLSPFKRINPCGYRGLEVTSTAEVGIDADTVELSDRLIGELKIRITG